MSVVIVMQVTGDASEEQVLLSVETYVDALEFLVQSLNDLFHLAKENTLVNQRRALEVLSTPRSCPIGAVV